MGGGAGVAEGRIATAWVRGVRGGVLCLFFYLWTSEGMSERNVELLAQGRGLVRHHRGPWAIGADFNMSPKEFQDEAGWWLDKVQRTIIGSGQATFRPARGTNGELDFFGGRHQHRAYSRPYGGGSFIGR